MSDFSTQIKEKARAIGFDLCGIAQAETPSDYGHFLTWLDRGFAASMSYLAQRKEERRDPSSLLPGVKSMIICALNYRTTQQKSTELAPGEGWIAQYALGEDYHRIMKEKLERLGDFLLECAGGNGRFKAYVDTGPILEKNYAARAGLGWMGKNTLLLHQELGSMFFLGEILTDIFLEPDQPTTDHCGSCRRCIDACPTGALVEPYVLDSNRCISYWTIEHRGEIPEEMENLTGHHLFGCDICQEVCPWNQDAPLTKIDQFQARPESFRPQLKEIANLNEEAYQIRFRRSAVKRAKRSGLMRNAKIALANKFRASFRLI
ncbi:MAG: tRNA epoxyqueuosine(34) reductase QueG [Deltaproteobacteria bacterium]|nr:tRNA epoxyqueuosine(34) reductase QueG [Deltaproteobacteria bacterium]